MNQLDEVYIIMPKVEIAMLIKIMLPQHAISLQLESKMIPPKT